MNLSEKVDLFLSLQQELYDTTGLPYISNCWDCRDKTWRLTDEKPGIALEGHENDPMYDDLSVGDPVRIDGLVFLRGTVYHCECTDDFVFLLDESKEVKDE